MGRIPKATKPKGTKPGRKRPPTAQLDVLDKNKQNARASFSQAPRTAKQYARYVEMGKEFLANVVTQRRERVEKEPSWMCPQGIDTDILAEAFEKPPNKHSVFALELFLTQKCIVEGNGKSTAEGVHGAFAKHWDTMCVVCPFFPVSADFFCFFFGCPGIETGTQGRIALMKQHKKLLDVLRERKLSKPS